MSIAVPRTGGHGLKTPPLDLAWPPRADYTFFVEMILSLFALGLFAQLDPVTAGMEPYVFVERQDPAHKLHVVADPKDVAQTFSPFLDVILDEPWLAEHQRYQKLRRSDYEEPRPQISTTRKRRIREGWLANGGVEVETADGAIWISGVEYELARRAEEMAAVATDGPESAQNSATIEQSGGEGLGFLSEWGMHLAIITAAAVLSALVIWITMTRGPWTPLGS